MKEKNQDSIVDRTKRLKIQLLVDCENDSTKVTYFIDNLSAGGLFIETNSPLPAKTKVTLNFTLPHNRAGYTIKGEVAWSGKKTNKNRVKAGMGIKFEHGDDDSEESICAAIEQYEKLLG